MLFRSWANRPIYIRILASLVVSIVIVVAILSTIYYLNINGIMSSQIYSSNLTNLNLISHEVTSLARMSSAISSQIYNDVSVSKMLHYSQLDYSDESMAMSQIKNYIFLFPMIDSIYVYNSKLDRFFTFSSSQSIRTGSKKANYFDRQVVTIIDHPTDYRPTIPFARRLTDVEGNLINKYYTFVMNDEIWARTDSVIVNIKESYIQNIIDESDVAGSQTYILDGKGVVVSDSAETPMLTDLSDRDYVQRILENPYVPGYFIAAVGGVKSLVVYTAKDSIGWTYVRVIRWDVLFKSLDNIKLILFGFSLAIMALGVLAAIAIARQLYRPIITLIRNVQTLEAEKKDNSIQMRHDFLRDLLLDSTATSSASVSERLTELGVAIPLRVPILLLLFRIDHYRSYLQQYNCEERAAVKKAILNAAVQELAALARLEAVDLDDNSVVIVLDGTNLAEADLKETLAPRLIQIQQTLLDSSCLSVTVAVSNIGADLETMHDLYLQAAETSLHRLFSGHRSILYASDILALSAAKYSYPLQREKAMIDSMMENRMEDVKKAFLETVMETADHPNVIFNLTVSHLIFTLNSTINVIAANNSLASGFEVSIPVGLVSEVETVDEFAERVFSILDRLGSALEDKKSQKYGSIVANINDFIEQRYAMPDLSISRIAEAMGMSDAYMCRIYKQKTLRTIWDTIVDTRMKKARELLAETDLPVSRVSELCGFLTSTYFYTVFKASNGVTPSEYRKKRQEGSGNHR